MVVAAAANDTFLLLPRVEPLPFSVILLFSLLLLIPTFLRSSPSQEKMNTTKQQKQRDEDETGRHFNEAKKQEARFKNST